METTNSWINFTVTRGPIRGKERNKIGLLVKVQTRRDVEDFMSGLAHGRTMAVDAVADTWLSGDPEGKPLEFYDVDQNFDNPRIYSLNSIGGSPLINNDRGGRLGVPVEDTINLSFLRLVGISEPNGVTVGFPGAYSGDYIRRLRSQLPVAMKQFLQDYLAPITINLQVISRNE